MKQSFDLTKQEFLNVLPFLIAVCNFFGEPFCRSRGQRISNYTSGLKNSSKIFLIHIRNHVVLNAPHATVLHQLCQELNSLLCVLG